MPLSLSGIGRDVAASREDAHVREGVHQYLHLFDAAATWITSRGVLIVGRDALQGYLARALPGGLAGGSVSYRVAGTVSAGNAVVVVAGQNTTVEEA